MDYPDGLSTEELQALFGSNDSDSNKKENLADIKDKDEGSHYISKFQSSMMLARFCVGSGLFSIAAAFRYSGIAAGIFWIFINGFLTAYGMKKLVKLSMEISNRRGGSAVYYGDLGEECVKAVFNEESAKYGRILVDGVIAFTTFALLCTQILYMAAIWKQGFEQLGVSEMDIRVWILVAFLVLFPLFQIRRPDILATCSLLANVLTVVGTISIFVHIFSTSTFRVHEMLQPNTNKVHWTKLPLTIGITSYAVQLVAPLMVTVRNVMKEPRKSPFVINIVMAVVSVLYAFMGATGYASCYPKCKDSIILNLPGTWYYSVVKVLLGLSSCVGTTLGVFICFAIVEPVLKYLLPENRFLIASITTRILMLTLAAGITAAVPQLGNVMSLAGILINPTVGFIFPAAAHIALFYKTLSRTSIAQDTALLFCGLLILVIGLYTSVYQMVHEFTDRTL